ncbi:MLO-like protein 3 isoform X2 [Sesamum indicum]|uniref:MLO-like protein n=1 Tax=Sesamum indicum TaxID=4182 RepID=A0A8M8VB86_SESIN|nr:MLO-like protein 3 isoform X2 [Sesamum indicum]
MAAGDSASTSLEHTPTWALATVCFFIVFVSVILEHSIHLLTNWLRRHGKTALYDAVGRLKSELMLLGFTSLLLAVTQDTISKICVPSKVANTMLPCRREFVTAGTESLAVFMHSFNRASADLIMADYTNFSDSINLHKLYSRRLADEDAGDGSSGGVSGTAKNTDAADSCSSKGKVSLVTEKAMQQLQIFIFVLAVTQIVYSVLTMALGRAKMRSWKAWEKETQSTDYQIANDPNRFRFTRQTTFARRHNTCTETASQLWIKCFFRQFFNSVAKVDYFTLRHGFIMAHFSARLNNFNFQKYIERSLDEDFKVVVSISPFMWFLVVIFMLVDVHGWHSYLWISYVPLLIVLVLGTKLEVIVAKMALQLKNQNNVVIGAPLVQLNDDLFWFRRPRFVLHLLHLTLFVNAFELAFFIWVAIQFGLDSCYHEHTVIIITRTVMAVAVQVLCSYITLPLYALVTQMGSEFKGEILKEQIAQVLKQWHSEVRDRRKNRERGLIQHPPTVTATHRGANNSYSKFDPHNASTSSPVEENHVSSISEIMEEQAEPS